MVHKSVDSAFIKSEARRVFDVVKNGGLAIFAVDIAYSLGGSSREAIERSLVIKKRAGGKKCGGLGNIEMSKELHILDNHMRDFISTVTVDLDLPLTIVAPVRMDHPYMQAMDPWVREISTKNGTFSMLINGGPLLNELAGMALKEVVPIVGSSANISLQGSNFSLEDIEPEIREAVDAETDLGLGKYYNPQGISSTIISLPDLDVIRFGAFYEKIADVAKKDFGLELPVRPTNYVHKEQLEAAAA